MRTRGASGQKLESPWTRVMCKQMRMCNAKVIAIVASSMQEPGLPDRLIWHKYWHGFLEFKGSKTAVTGEQTSKIRELNGRVPDSAYVVREPDRIENCCGILVARFDGTGSGLLQTLRRLHDV